MQSLETGAERGRLRLAVLAWFGVVGLLGALKADFLPPKKLTDTGGLVRQTTVGTDLTLNVYVAWTAGSDMVLNIMGIQVSQKVSLSSPELGSGDPSMATDSMGTTYMVFTQDDPSTWGREVFLVSNPGGSFQSTPRNVSRNPGDDHAPKLFLDGLGQPHLVWAEDLARTEVRYLPPGGAPVTVAEGDYPGIAIDAFGTVYIVYRRNNDLYVVNNRNPGRAFGAEVAVTRTPRDQEFFPSIAVTESGVVFIAYELWGGLYYHQSSPGGGRFGPPRLLDNGGVNAPELRVTRDFLSIVYEKEGDIYYIVGKVGGVLVGPVQVTSGPEVETSPSLAIDARGVVHIAFIREGEVYYTNNSGQLIPEFSADTRQGEVPLEVRFDDLSSGAIEGWYWDFGDGSPPSSERQPLHVYQSPGRYTVRLEISGTGTHAALEKKDYIFVQTANNRLCIPDQTVLPGQKDIWYPVKAFHKEPMKGFQIAGTFDPNVLTLRDITSLVTSLDVVDTEFFKPSWSNERVGAYFFVGAIFDFEPPFEDQTLPPGTSQTLAQLIFDCSPTAPQGGTTVVELKNGVGPGSLFNSFFINGSSVLPLLCSSTTSILTLDEPWPVLFKRGDVDRNAAVDLSDAIGILDYLFLGATAPRCMDAADFEDSGAVDIADAISLLTFLFLGGSPPAVPFPNEGLDPTEDNLRECRA